MLIEQRFTPGLAIYSYIIGDEQAGEAAVIDPTRDVQPYIDYARKHSLKIKYIIETHVQADFVSGACEMKDRLGSLPQIYCSGYGGEDWTQSYADHHVKDGDSIEIGKIRLDFLHTPGHTPEHIAVGLFDTSRSKDVPWMMFTGDVLFVGAAGRPDLLGEEVQKKLANELYKSLFGRLAGIPDCTEIYPGHGSGSLCGKAIGARHSSTMGYERLFNPAMQKKDQAEWVKELLEDMPLSAPYFARMKEINRKGPVILGPKLPGQEGLSVEAAQKRIEQGALVLDVRSKEAFAASHVAGSVNIGAGKNFAPWAGWVLPYDQDILLIADGPADVAEVTTELIRIGQDRVIGYLDGGMDAWQQAGKPFAHLRTLSVLELQDQFGDGSNSLTLLDVRTASEWEAGHIEGAIHIHGGLLKDKMGQVGRDKPVAVICGSGYRASVAASLLQANQYAPVCNVLGGMTAWKKAKLPTVEG